ncbi:MAG: hypothetical protein QOK42_1891 [Frankiaceae bacterium]|jgi:hypothetical protein|nr:hypothetical protein [Frankiaceae bacterium]MDX6224063.1 hypothetical protein [Frankiales bacterium]
MRRSLPVLAVSAALFLGAAGSGHAATLAKPQVVDAAGDEVTTQASQDITSIQWSTTGITTVKKVGKKKVTTYTPKNLVATMNLAAAPDTRPGVRYVVNAASDCGDLNLTVVHDPTGAVVPTGYTACGGGATVDPEVTFGPTSVAWTIPLAVLPFKVGSALSAFDGYVDASEFVIGVVGTGDAVSVGIVGDRTLPSHGTAAADFAKGDVTWKIG